MDNWIHVWSTSQIIQRTVHTIVCSTSNDLILMGLQWNHVWFWIWYLRIWWVCAKVNICVCCVPYIWNRSFGPKLIWYNWCTLEYFYDPQLQKVSRERYTKPCNTSNDLILKSRMDFDLIFTDHADSCEYVC